MMAILCLLHHLLALIFLHNHAKQKTSQELSVLGYGKSDGIDLSKGLELAFGDIQLTLELAFGDIQTFSRGGGGGALYINLTGMLRRGYSPSLQK